MKISVVVDKNGTVVGTYRPPAQAAADGPTFQLQAGPGQTLRELDLPPALENLTSADELHRRLGEFLKTAPPNRG